MSFTALMVEKPDTDAPVSVGLQQLTDAELPTGGDVTVAIDYSTLNYKDGLCLTGNGGLVRQYPHIPGIDFAGTVEQSDDTRHQPGDKVVLTGWRVGEVWWGGYAQKARVKGDWLVPLPDGFSTRQAMQVGTAGFTAMLAIDTLERHELTPDAGEVLVTGASGGVGSIACALLAALGYQAVAVSGRAELTDYLTDLGAKRVIARDELNEPSKKPLESESWAGCIDAVGGTMLARVLAQTQYGGSVAAVGLAGGPKLQTTVVPFLLRGVNLLGIDSVMQPRESREHIWQRLVKTLQIDKLDATTTEVGLHEIAAYGEKILAGQVKGRVIVDVNRHS